MTLDYRTLTGEEVEAALDDLARLRIEVFRAWPYLYDGDLAYERQYMSSYRDNPRAVLVAAFDGDRIVGASTGTPLLGHDDQFAKAFAEVDIPMADVFYCAESVLLPEYRGQGAGHVFFDIREAHARSLGYLYSAFCGVIRPDDHPARPDAYVPLDGFWRKRGYRKLDGAIAIFRWKDHGQPEETPKPLQFWIKPL